MSAPPAYRPDPRHAELGGEFFDPVDAARFPSQILRFRNQRWAERVGLGDLDEADWLRHFAAFEPLPGNLPRPLALRYHGHQFRNYNPDLGDGRGFLFAQLRDVADDRLLDLGTKGSGQTPWSRQGDGRLTLKGGVREVLATELLEALGVYTSKTFSLVETGEELMRGDEPSPTRSSVMVRLSHSHIRFGSFQRQAFLERPDLIQELIDYSVAQYYPELLDLEGEERIIAFLSRVIAASADLAASWMVSGFVHGVLNTDNMNITGESFDYGPYRFLPTLDFKLTAAYFDHNGLYAYGRQPETVLWNLTRLAETMLPICDKDALVEVLQGFDPRFHRASYDRTLRRLGLDPGKDAAGEEVVNESEAEVVNAIYGLLHETQVGFERFFFDWYMGPASADRARRSPDAVHYDSPACEKVVASLEGYSPLVPDALDHAYFEGDAPCTLLIDEIESIWARIADDDDWSAYASKLDEIALMREALSQER